eukprot:TRINITY_DN26645_c0_g1_i1.p1 TRINITY_DN26645_c0_g1~~TRINITY_DN26645_c0_g1_i1.p1  ORF type:complete len:512 (-),score=27.68 TRINITY_DN26645_c0_g1_i1:251-1786(-)
MTTQHQRDELRSATIHVGRKRGTPFLGFTHCSLAVIIGLSYIFSSCVTSAVASDLITSLPGQPNHAPFFRQYAGYVNINAKTGKNLFYYLVEAVKFPRRAPLVLWLNGGPGCSSLIGFLEEIGPWRVTNASAQQLSFNPYSWNHFANVLFLEAPAGTGFSYSKSASDYNINDEGAAADIYAFLKGFLTKYPGYTGRDFYITGESYAGKYIPMTSALILAAKAKGKGLGVHFSGIAIGNAYTDDYYDGLGTYSFLSGHAIIPTELYEQIVANCPKEVFYGAPLTGKCFDRLYSAYSLTRGIDPYNVYAKLCLYSGNTAITQATQLIKLQQKKRLGKSLAAASSNSRSKTRAATSGPKASRVTDPSCYDVWMTRYLNRPAVQKAIHATHDASTLTWSECSYVLNYTADVGTVIPVVQALIKSGLRVWYYTGDADSVVPFDGTERWISGLGLPVLEYFRPWKDSTGQVGGRVVRYQNLTLATVRGAAHEVPYSNPVQAFTLIQKFLSGSLLPYI